MWSFPRYLPNKLHLDGNHDYRHCIYQRLNKPGEKEKSKVNDPMTRRTMTNSSSPYFWKAITAGLLYPVYRHPFWGRGDVCTQARLLTMAHVWWSKILTLLPKLCGRNCKFFTAPLFCIPRRDLGKKKTKPNIGKWLESLGVVLEFYYIERGPSEKNSRKI